jgi:hypothetical protein
VAAAPLPQQPAIQPRPIRIIKEIVLDAAGRSALLLRMARASEKDGRNGQAIGYYKEIVANYPGSIEAKTADDRLKALGPSAPVAVVANELAR